MHRYMGAPQDRTLRRQPDIWGLHTIQGFPGANSRRTRRPCRRHETRAGCLGQEDPLEEGMATHSCILAWRIRQTEEPGGMWATDRRKFRRDWAAGHRRPDTCGVKEAMGPDPQGKGGERPGGEKRAHWVNQVFPGEAPQGELTSDEGLLLVRAPFLI